MRKILLAFILLTALITGCDGNNANNPVADNTGAENRTNPATQISESESNAPEKEYIPPEMKGEITISVLDDSELINSAANLFMDKYPNIKVTVNTFRKVDTVKLEGGAEMSGTPSEEFSTENYLSLLNTKIITGKAEDIIVTDPIPLRKYTDMGVFEDLSFFLSQSSDINDESHYMEAFEIMKDKKGSLYEIPLTWNPSRIIFFDKTLVEDSKLLLDDGVRSMNYQEAYEFAKKLADSTNKPNTFLGMGNSAISAAFDVMNIKDFIDFESKKVDINNERFINILRWAKALEEQGYYDTNETVDFYNMEYHFALGDDFSMQAAYYALLPDTVRYHSMPVSDADGNIGAYAFPCLGINSASKNKELAWEFIKFLLSDEFQTSPSLFGLCINKKGFDASVERNLKMYNDGNQAKVSKQEYEGLLKDWMSQINYYYEKNENTGISLFTEAKKFFDGEQSAEDTAKILQSKLDKYLNE